MKKKSPKVEINKKQKIKGVIFICLGIFGFLIDLLMSINNVRNGGSFLIVLISLAMIWEGWRTLKGKKSILFMH